MPLPHVARVPVPAAGQRPGPPNCPSLKIPRAGREPEAEHLPASSFPDPQNNTSSLTVAQGGSHQTLWAKRVVSLILPSMEAVRQVPQSMAVLQSTVTTGARWPPRLRQVSRTFSSPPSCKGTGERRRGEQTLFINTFALPTKPRAWGLPPQRENVPGHTGAPSQKICLIVWSRKCPPNYGYSNLKWKTSPW